jgi:hypothetical protein
MLVSTGHNRWTSETRPTATSTSALGYGRFAQIPVIRRGLAEPVNSTRTGLSPGMAVWCWLPLVGVIARLKDKGRPEGGLLPCSSD